MLYYRFRTPLGVMQAGYDSDYIYELCLVKGKVSRTDSIPPHVRDCELQLGEYFAGRRRDFSLPLRAEGTEFRRRVWKALEAIPYGETRSYGEIAGLIGRPQAVRAVGGALHRNPLMIVLPCHRVIGADGSLTGYAEGLEVKRFLLELEKRHK